MINKCFFREKEEDVYFVKNLYIAEESFGFKEKEFSSLKEEIHIVELWEWTFGIKRDLA